jgi:hypothetical protein
LSIAVRVAWRLVLEDFELPFERPRARRRATRCRERFQLDESEELYDFELFDRLLSPETQTVNRSSLPFLSRDDFASAYDAKNEAIKRLSTTTLG